MICIIFKMEVGQCSQVHEAASVELGFSAWALLSGGGVEEQGRYTWLLCDAHMRYDHVPELSDNISILFLFFSFLLLVFPVSLSYFRCQVKEKSQNYK